MKKALSIVLALVMCLSMSVMAFAEDTQDAAAPIGELTDTTEAATEASKDDAAPAEVNANKTDDKSADKAEEKKDVKAELKGKFDELVDKAKGKAEEIKENEKVAEAVDAVKGVADNLKDDEKVDAVVDAAKDVVKEVEENEVVAEVVEKGKSVFSELLNTANDWEGLQAMLGDLNPEQINEVLKTTGESINKLTNGKINLDLDGSLDGLFNGIKKAVSESNDAAVAGKDKDVADIGPAAADAFFGALEKLGIDKDKVLEKFQNSKILNVGAKLYTYGAVPAVVPTPENPQTGSTAAIAVFAVLSVAAAAAFVCGKKED